MHVRVGNFCLLNVVVVGVVVFVIHVHGGVIATVLK